MKRSKEVVLVLIASASLAACGPDTQETRREVYASRDNCAEDWGGDKCEEQAGGRGYWGPHYYYLGGRTYYFPRGSDNPVPAGQDVRFSSVPPGTRSARSLGTVTSSHIVRGGFGRTGSYHGSGS